eukprot:snap_masked-scaffold_2-processed-gene-13.15-mRNA-1 protein AED:1.00 eAED:1.00 QI:0/0/0/0/1/1/2/0/62
MNKRQGNLGSKKEKKIVEEGSGPWKLVYTYAKEVNQLRSFWTFFKRFKSKNKHFTHLTSDEL